MDLPRSIFDDFSNDGWTKSAGEVAARDARLGELDIATVDDGRAKAHWHHI